MNYQPLRDVVILKEIFYPEKRDRLIIIERKKHDRVGEVVAIGEGYEREGVKQKAEFKVGDKVVWDKNYGVQRFKQGEDTYVVCNSFAYIVAKLV